MKYLNEIRPVLFLFYMLETLVNIILMHFYLTALSFIRDTQVMETRNVHYYSYLLIFYVFTVMTLFASVKVCTKNQPSILEEVLRPLVGFIAYTILTLSALADAQADFPLMFPKSKKEDLLQPEPPLQPFFRLLRSQATASLVCSVVYLLHSLIALDVLLSNEDSETEVSDDVDEIVDMIEVEYQPVRLYVLGGQMQRWLESFQWFRDYISDQILEI